MRDGGVRLILAWLLVGLVMAGLAWALVRKGRYHLLPTDRIVGALIGALYGKLLANAIDQSFLLEMLGILGGAAVGITIMRALTANRPFWRR
jgi:uncharacterized membrane protein YeaQ/YmgE (transglycosylase-associated protein family)